MSVFFPFSCFIQPRQRHVTVRVLHKKIGPETPPKTPIFQNFVQLRRTLPATCGPSPRRKASRKTLFLKLSKYTIVFFLNVDFGRKGPFAPVRGIQEKKQLFFF